MGQEWYLLGSKLSSKEKRRALLLLHKNNDTRSANTEEHSGRLALTLARDTDIHSPGLEWRCRGPPPCGAPGCHSNNQKY